MPDYIRIKKIESYFLEQLARIVQRELKNPIFKDNLISFPSIKVSKDLSVSHVAVSVLGDEAAAKAVVEALTEAEPVIRRELRKCTDLRKTPKIIFHEDHTIEQAAKIDAILNSLVIPPEETSPPEPPLHQNGEGEEEDEKGEDELEEDEEDEIDSDDELEEEEEEEDEIDCEDELEEEEEV
jgi:ribosome-binding factor A